MNANDYTSAKSQGEDPDLETMVLTESAAIIRLVQSLSVAPCPPNDSHDQAQAAQRASSVEGSRERRLAAARLCRTMSLWLITYVPLTPSSQE